MFWILVQIMQGCMRTKKHSKHILFWECFKWTVKYMITNIIQNRWKHKSCKRNTHIWLFFFNLCRELTGYLTSNVLFFFYSYRSFFVFLDSSVICWYAFPAFTCQDSWTWVIVLLSSWEVIWGRGGREKGVLYWCRWWSVHLFCRRLLHDSSKNWSLPKTIISEQEQESHIHFIR